MIWFRRKEDSRDLPERDPRIDMARQKNQQSAGAKTPADGSTRVGQPGIVDSEFCYGGDSGPCA